MDSLAARCHAPKFATTLVCGDSYSSIFQSTCPIYSFVKHCMGTLNCIYSNSYSDKPCDHRHRLNRLELRISGPDVYVPGNLGIQAICGFSGCLGNLQII